jgi:hypothetical protein
LTSLMDDKSVISMNNNINNDNNFNIENNEWNEINQRLFAVFFIFSTIYSLLKFIYNSFWYYIFKLFIYLNYFIF